jgi:hypothetical protein
MLQYRGCLNPWISKNFEKNGTDGRLTPVGLLLAKQKWQYFALQLLFQPG